MGKIKIIKGVKIPPLFHDKSCFKGAFIVAMMGLAGAAISIGRYIFYFHDSGKSISETDAWEVLVISLFLLAMFLPSALMLYFSHTIVKIIEALVEDK